MLHGQWRGARVTIKGKQRSADLGNETETAVQPSDRVKCAATLVIYPSDGPTDLGVIKEVSIMHQLAANIAPYCLLSDPQVPPAPRVCEVTYIDPSSLTFVHKQTKALDGYPARMQRRAQFKISKNGRETKMQLLRECFPEGTCILCA